MNSTRVARRERWLNGLPRSVEGHWLNRLLRSPLLWLVVVLVPLYLVGLYDMYSMLSPSQEYPDGTRSLGIDDATFKLGAYWAMWTALAWSVLFVWLDRFRASSPAVWLLTFGWGGCMATWISLYVNSWASKMMATTQADAYAGSRGAVFSAPFIEELSKATILVLLVILWRNKIVSRLSMVALAGLSAVGFAFVENIIYYARVWMQATNDITVARPEEVFLELVMLRGVYTSFGHPLFTLMTASGLVIGLGARSKIVRVLAPVAGFMLAAAGHMLFNGLASTNPAEELVTAWYFALGLVAVIVISLIVSVIGNGQLIKARLDDFRRAGWLSQREVEIFGGPLRRQKLLLYALFRGPKKWWYTATLIRRMTELAYLRNQMTRGLVAEVGDEYAKNLLQEVAQLRSKALADYQGLTLIEPRPKKQLNQNQASSAMTITSYPPPVAPGPAGVGGNWPAR